METVKVIVVDNQGAPVSFNASSGQTVTASDTEPNLWDVLWIGTAGDLHVILKNDDHVLVYENVPTGWMEINTKKIMAATTATGIIGHVKK